MTWRVGGGEGKLSGREGSSRRADEDCGSETWGWRWEEGEEKKEAEWRRAGQTAEEWRDEMREDEGA